MVEEGGHVRAAAAAFWFVFDVVLDYGVISFNVTREGIPFTFVGVRHGDGCVLTPQRGAVVFGDVQLSDCRVCRLCSQRGISGCYKLSEETVAGRKPRRFPSLTLAGITLQG